MNNNPNLSKDSFVDSQNQTSPQAMRPEAKIAALPIQLILKYLAIFIAVFFVAIIETGFFSKLRIFGVSPDLCLALTVAVSLKWGAKKGAIIGIMSGFLVDAFSSVGISLLIPFYFALAIVVGLCTEGKSANGFPFFLSTMLIAGSFRALLTFFTVHLTSSVFSASEVLIQTMIPHFIITLIFSPIIHLAVIAVDKLFGKRDRGPRL